MREGCSSQDGEYSQSGSHRYEVGSHWRMEGCKKEEKEGARNEEWLNLLKKKIQFTGPVNAAFNSSVVICSEASDGPHSTPDLS